MLLEPDIAAAFPHEAASCPRELPVVAYRPADECRGTGGARYMARRGVAAVVLAAFWALVGCQALLPSGKSEIISGWASYEEAEAALAEVEPYQSTRQELHDAGLDPRTNSSLAVLNFAEVMQRFAVSALADPNGYERGIQDCLRAGQRCTAYSVKAERTYSQRVGNFWLDLLSFKRETESTGWNFNALIVLVNDLVVYRITSGQPRIHAFEVSRQPLGPLQNIGESLRPAIR